MNDHCLDKLCTIVAAAGIIALGLQMGFVAVGVLEATVATGGLLLGIKRARQGDFRRMLGTIKQKVATGYREWIEDAHRQKPWYLKANIDNAVYEFEQIIDRCVPAPKDVVGVDLNAERLAKALLAKAEIANPSAYGRDSDNPAAREIFLTIIAQTYQHVRSHPDYGERLRTYIDEAALTRLGEIKQDTGEIKRDTAEIRAVLTALAAQVSADKSVPLPVLQEILRRLGDVDTPFDAASIEQRLRTKADEYSGLQDRLLRLSNDDPQVLALRKKAAVLISDGGFAAADNVLRQAEKRDLEAVEELEAVAKRRRISAAESRADRAAAARLCLDYLAAAGHYAEAIAILPVDETSLRWLYAFAQAGALYDRGVELGDNQSLRDAIDAYRSALTLASRDRVPLNWAGTQNDLGNALVRLGERESGTARLEEAVAAYRTALQEWSRDHVPCNWAGAQNNLGNVLLTLGERESGTARLEEAVAAYRAALKELSRDHVPRDWAGAQNNLGNALVRLGHRESGTARLEEAVAAYRAALEELSRGRMPLDWAMTQNNLGGAFVELGERESGTARLKEAVAAYRAALEERRRDRVPLDWAMTQNNLGMALRALGERESGTARLEEAVAACRAALEEYTRDRVPLDWAMTQNDLGRALRALGERESGTARLEEAVLAYRAALEERSRDRVPLAWATTQNNLGNALRALGQRESGTARLEEAVLAYGFALEERSRDRVPLDWAATQNDLGNALWTLGQRKSGTARLEEAVAAFDACLTVAETAWLDEWVQGVRSHRDENQAEITRRRAAK